LANYNADDQLVEIRAFWEEYGRPLMVGVVLAVLAVGSWSFWDRSQIKSAEEASTIYSNMVKSYQELENVIIQEKFQAVNGELALNQNNKLAKLEKFQESVSTLKKQYANTEYAHYAALQNAKYFVSQNDLASAENELKDILKNGPNEHITLLTKLRLARVLFAAEKYDEALKLAEANKSEAYTSAFQELAGDIYFQQGNRELAFQAYSKAKESTEEPSEDLQMKYYDLLTK